MCGLFGNLSGLFKDSFIQVYNKAILGLQYSIQKRSTNVARIVVLLVRTYLATYTPGNISVDVRLQLSCGQLSWSMVLLICHPRMKRQMDLDLKYWNE